jgi:hypothetical protein
MNTFTGLGGWHWDHYTFLHKEAELLRSRPAFLALLS